MSRFHLFAGESYYPNGGVDDWKGCFESVELAIQAAMLGPSEEEKEEGYYSWDWAHVAELVDGKMTKIAEGKTVLKDEPLQWKERGL